MQGGATLEAFGVGDRFAADLATCLLALRLDPRIGWRGLGGRPRGDRRARVPGKAVLEVAS